VTESSILPRSRVSAQPVPGTLTINEPTRDPKGKKRAAPESVSDSEDIPASSSSSNKRPRPSTSSYSLRSREVVTSPTMPRKTKCVPRNHTRSTLADHVLRPSPTKPKGSKSKSTMGASSSRDDDDVHMHDPEYSPERNDDCMDPDLPTPPPPPPAPADAPEDGGGEEARDDSEDEQPTGQPGRGSLGSDAPSMDEAAAMAALFGSDFRAFGSYMQGQTTRLKSLLNNIKMTEDPTTRLLALQELSELLSMSTEDTLSGFPMEPYIRELIRILGGSGNNEDDENDGDGDEEMHDEDAALAAALAMSNGGKVYLGDENPEAQVLACRCLANLMEALPGVAHTIVYHGALPVLCSKLVEISYIDLAEQTLSVRRAYTCLCVVADRILADTGEDFGGVPKLDRS
jgi:E3 ubiquitin-protein ligase TRIP12